MVAVTLSDIFKVFIALTIAFISGLVYILSLQLVCLPLIILAGSCCTSAGVPYYKFDSMK